MTDCPLCQSPASLLERLSDGWKFCNGCARCFLLDAEGHYVRSVGTQHAPRREPFNTPKVERDVNGVVIRGD